MNIIKSIDDIALLREQVDLECKLAAGRDGTGALPEDFWPTYSAFANTDGGIVLLGLREKNNEFRLEGIINVAKVRKELFDTLNNRTKVSINLLKNSDVEEITIDGKTILAVRVPRALRKQRPVHLTPNPLGQHAYRRMNCGDFAISDEDVKRMLAEQIEESRDTKVLTGFRMADLDNETLRVYRQIFATRSPAHVWNTIEDIDFLREIGGWRTDRETGDEGPTLAGLLMFGKMRAIQEELPNYMLDYREFPMQMSSDVRWLDRITLDGNWSGNLFDFYRKVYAKLTAELKVPFLMEKGVRKEESSVHEALREALANVLVHADYTDRASVLVVKRADFFGFRNPGLMRIPVEDALRGGDSDCRNRTLHKIFRLVGVGEQAGTGIPKILHDWKSQQWTPPRLWEQATPFNQTLLELRMVDLFPVETVTLLRSRFGRENFDMLPECSRVALALAAGEKTLTHQRLREVRPEHPVDLSRTLQDLVQAGFLETTGGRHAVYHVKGQSLPSAEEVLGSPPPVEISHDWPSFLLGSPFGNDRLFPENFTKGMGLPDMATSLSGLNPSLSGLNPSLSGLNPSLSGLGASLSGLSKTQELKRDAYGRIINEKLNFPIIDALWEIGQPLRDELVRLAEEARTNRKLPKERLRSIIVQLCQGQFICRNCLGELLERNPRSLRAEHLAPMVKDRTLVLAFPTTPTHEKQAYGCPSKEQQRAK